MSVSEILGEVSRRARRKADALRVEAKELFDEDPELSRILRNQANDFHKVSYLLGELNDGS